MEAANVVEAMAPIIALRVEIEAMVGEGATDDPPPVELEGGGSDEDGDEDFVMVTAEAFNF